MAEGSGQRSFDRPGAASGPRARGAGRALRTPGVLLVAACFSIEVGCGQPPPPPAFGSGLAQVPASSGVRQQERAMFERLNRDREANGLPPLRLDERLSEVARHHSADMRDHHFFEHESPRTGGVDDRLDAAGYAFLGARENLSEAPDIERSQEGLLRSPPHHANIMARDVTHVGIGIVQGGVVDPRNLTVTQVFARPAEEEPPRLAERRALERLDRERRARQLAPAERDAELMRLAAEHLAELGDPGDEEAVERAGQSIVAALKAREAGSVLISAQLVPGSEQLSFPGPALAARRCAVGLAARRARGERGRPALQVLLLVKETASQR